MTPSTGYRTGVVKFSQGFAVTINTTKMRCLPQRYAVFNLDVFVAVAAGPFFALGIKKLFG